MEQWIQALAPIHHHKRLRQRLKKKMIPIAINSNCMQKFKFAQSRCVCLQPCAILVWSSNGWGAISTVPHVKKVLFQVLFKERELEVEPVR